MDRKAASNKIMILGLDAMDPKLTKKYVEKGIMPNTKKFIERGSCREDSVLLGAQPTVTPPMWTTMATGAYPVTHGITCFYRTGEDLDVLLYNLDSQLCKAEQLWNVFAEAGKKTLVWHWPGSAWPPSSDSPNLMVVDGTSPGTVGQGGGAVDSEFILGASVNVKESTFLHKAAANASAPCLVEGKIDKDPTAYKKDISKSFTMKERRKIMLTREESSLYMTEMPIDVVQSPIKDATGWADAPEGAKEMTMLLSKGFIRRPCLILKNADGIYDSIAVYKSKKETVPIATLPVGVFVRDIVDVALRDDKQIPANRHMKLLEMKEDGTELKLYVSAAMDINFDDVWHPQSLFRDIVDNVGYPQPTSMLGGQDQQLINECMLGCWTAAGDWQAKSINYLIENEGVEIVFSHFHAIDMQIHMFVQLLHDRGENKLPPELYQKFLEDIYIEVDNYIGQFLHLLDEEWTVMIVSDHAQVCSTNQPPWLGDAIGINVNSMVELGYTVLKKDENGNPLREIDWEHTRAIAPRANQIYINLKGRNKYGIVDPADKYELEEQIMTDLYSYKHEKTGKRMIALAIRNKDAVLLGMGGPECGDILYWTSDGYTYDHADMLSTACGEADTTAGPIFIAAGKGIKENFITDRIIRQVDVAPTMAVLGGVRMPAQCEGAPVYQILTEEY